METQVPVRAQRGEHRARDRADTGLDAVAVVDEFGDPGADALGDRARPTAQRRRLDLCLDRVVEPFDRYCRCAGQAGEGPVPLGDEGNVGALEKRRQELHAEAERAVPVPVGRRELGDRQVDRTGEKVIPDVPVLHGDEADRTGLETGTQLRCDEEAPHRGAGPRLKGRGRNPGDAGDQELDVPGRFGLPGEVQRLRHAVRWRRRRRPPSCRGRSSVAT